MPFVFQKKHLHNLLLVHLFYLSFKESGILIATTKEQPIPMTNDQLLYYETHQTPSHTDWLVLVHGAGGSTRTWKRQIDQLGAQYNLLVVDLPGHGQNSGRTFDIGRYSFEAITDKIWEVVDHLQIAKVHLVGISLGTILCLQMRISQPQRVLSVIMPGAIVRLNTKLRLLANGSLTLAKVIGYRNFYKLSAYIMMPRGNHKQSRDVFIKESHALTVEEFKNWTNLYYHLNATLNEFFKSTTTIPHILIMGSQDHLFLPPAKAYADFHKNASISIIPNCGHVVSIEKAEQFNEICLSFLSQLNIVNKEFLN